MVEYVLLTVVIITVVTLLFGKIRNFVMGNGRCTPRSKQLVCRVERAVSFGEGSSLDLPSRYRTFRL